MHVHRSDIYISSCNVSCGFISASERVGDLREKYDRIGATVTTSDTESSAHTHTQMHK